jgi:hypothetical protein
MLMFHENEPGAWDFARALEERGVPIDAIPISRDVDPKAFVRLGEYLARERPRILHTHLVHADAYGQMRGALSRPRPRLDQARPTVSRGRAFRSLTAASLARSRPHRYLAGPRALPRRDGGLRRVELRDRPLRDRAARSRRRTPVSSHACLRRPADSDQGPYRVAARVRRGSQAQARPDARHAGRGRWSRR